MLVLEFGSILLMLKICDSLSHGAELKLMKICEGKTFAQVCTWSTRTLLFRGNGYEGQKA